MVKLRGTIFDSLILKDSALMLRSKDLTSGEQGLHFGGLLELTDDWAFFVTLLGGRSELPVFSRISIQEDKWPRDYSSSSTMLPFV